MTNPAHRHENQPLQHRRATVLVLQPGITGELEACWIRRYSPAVGGWTWEIPAHEVGAAERTVDAAMRATCQAAGSAESLLIRIAELASGADPVPSRVVHYAALLVPGAPREPSEDLCWAPLRAWGSLSAGEPAAPASRDAAAALGLLWTTGLLARLESVWSLLRENRLYAHPKLGRGVRERLIRRDSAFAARVFMIPGQDAARVLEPLPLLREADPLMLGRLGIAWLAGDPRVARIEAL